jgi:hypothetical protein
MEVDHYCKYCKRSGRLIWITPIYCGILNIMLKGLSRFEVAEDYLLQAIKIMNEVSEQEKVRSSK